MILLSCFLWGVFTISNAAHAATDGITTLWERTYVGITPIPKTASTDLSGTLKFKYLHLPSLADGVEIHFTIPETFTCQNFIQAIISPLTGVPYIDPLSLSFWDIRIATTARMYDILRPRSLASPPVETLYVTAGLHKIYQSERSVDQHRNILETLKTFHESLPSSESGTLKHKISEAFLSHARWRCNVLDGIRSLGRQ